MTTDAREITKHVADIFLSADWRRLQPSDAERVKMVEEILTSALRQRELEVRAEERERIIRVLGADKVADLAHHAIGVWQAFEESHLFNNSAENGQKIRDAVEDARQIVASANTIRRDSEAQEGEQQNGK
jgi:hypothetical protein